MDQIDINKVIKRYQDLVADLQLKIILHELQVELLTDKLAEYQIEDKYDASDD